MEKEIEYTDYVDVEVSLLATRNLLADIITHKGVHRLYGVSMQGDCYKVHEEGMTYIYPIRRINKIIKTKIRKHE